MKRPVQAERKVARLLVLAGAGVLLWAVMSLSFCERRRVDVPAGSTFIVRRAPLTISVEETGTFRHRQEVIVRSEVEGHNTILYLIPQGTRVAEGDLLVELDASGRREALALQEMETLKSETAYILARETVRIVENETASTEMQAHVDWQMAEAAVERYVNGEYPQARRTREAAVHMAEERLQRARDQYSWSQRLQEHGYLTRMELQDDELALHKAVVDLEQAKGDAQFFEDYEHPHKRESLESDAREKALRVDRLNRQGESERNRARDDLRIRETEWRRQRARQESIQREIEQCRILAPTNGVVVYRSVVTGWFQEETVHEGLRVWRGQELIALPVGHEMMVDVNIPESKIAKIDVGLPVRIHVADRSRSAITGRVASIAPLPDAIAEWLNPDLKTYGVSVHVDESLAWVRMGSGCRVEILVEEIEDALYVPLQSVAIIEGQGSVLVATENGVARRAVVLGLDNGRVIHIRSGLEEGERVMLTVPDHANH